MKANEYVTDFEQSTDADCYREAAVNLLKWIGWKAFWLICIIVVL